MVIKGRDQTWLEDNGCQFTSDPLGVGARLPNLAAQAMLCLNHAATGLRGTV